MITEKRTKIELFIPMASHVGCVNQPKMILSHVSVVSAIAPDITEMHVNPTPNDTGTDFTPATLSPARSLISKSIDKRKMVANMKAKAAKFFGPNR